MCVLALPALGSEPRVGVVQVEVVPSENNMSVPLQSVLGDVSMRTQRWVPVQLHHGGADRHVSGLRPNA